jgi:putative transcriptional regulator
MLLACAVDDANRTKITMRHIDREQSACVEPLSPEEIRAVRDRARMSQAVFARHLNVTTGYVSQLERGAKHPTGAALVLLDVIRRKGIEAIL